MDNQIRTILGATLPGREAAERSPAKRLVCQVAKALIEPLEPGSPPTSPA